MIHHSKYAWFYGLLRQMQCATKEEIILAYTEGRTESLKELSMAEYQGLCSSMERQLGKTWGASDEKKAARHRCLKLMKQWGVDTSDWAKVDAFCLQPRIRGAEFRRLSLRSLEILARQLSGMIYKRDKNNKQKQKEHEKDDETRH